MAAPFQSAVLVMFTDISQLCTLGLVITFACLVSFGLAKHEILDSASYVSRLARVIYASELLHILGIGFVKLSAGPFILRSLKRRCERQLLSAILCECPEGIYVLSSNRDRLYLSANIDLACVLGTGVLHPRRQRYKPIS
jgi:hypothetical protein